MSQYGNIGQLNIEIQANSELAIKSLERLASVMSSLTFGNVSGLKEFTKDLKALAKVDFSGNNIGNSLSNLQAQITGLNFEASGLTTLVDSIKKLGSKSVDNAIGKMPLLADAMTQLFNKLSVAPVIRQDVIDMTKALADFTANGGKVGSASRKIASGMDKMGKSAKKNKGLIAQFFAGFSAGNFAGNFTANILSSLIRGFINPIFTAIRESIDGAYEYASSLVETQNILERTFGNSIDVVEDFSKTALKMYGMNELESKKMIGIFQAMGTALGETKERMADVSTSLGAIVGDYASFFNMNVKDVANDFTAIFTGQTKAMRKYGIDLTNAQLQDFADKQGWNVQVKSLNQYNKAIIRYNYLVSRSQDILGDFQRTQGSYANQVKLLDQQFKELFGTLGQIGTAVLTPILRVLNEVIAKIRQFAEQLVAFLGIDNFKSISGGAVEGLEDLADGFDDVAEAEKKAKTYSTGIDELNVLKPNESASKGNGAGELGAGWDTDWWDKLEKGKQDITDFTELLEHLQWVFTPIKDAFGRMWEDGLKPFIDESNNALSQLREKYLEPLAHWSFREVAPIVIDISTNMVQHLTDDLEVAKVILFRFFDQIKNSGWSVAITTTLKNVIAPIIDLINEAFTRALQLAQPFFAFIGGAISWIGDVLKGIVSQIDLTVITNPLKDIWNSVVGILDESGLTEKIVKLWEILRPMGEALGSVIGKGLQLILTLLGEVIRALAPIIEFVAGVVFKGIGATIEFIGGAVEGLEEPLNDVAGFIEKIINLISGAGQWVGDRIRDLIGFFTGGSKEPEVNVEVKANTESVKQELESIETNKEIEIQAKVDSTQIETSLSELINSIDKEKTKVDLEPQVDSSKVSTATTEAITFASTNNPPKIEITPEIKTESVTQAFDELNSNILAQGEIINASMSQIGETATTTLNTTFTNNNSTLIEIITENATTIKTTFEDAKIGLGIKGNTSTIFEEYGLAVVNGFKSGIEKNKQLSLNAVSVWVKDIMRTFVGNDVEGINYNVWFEYAHQVMLGFAEGITYWSYLAKEAVERWVSEMMSEFEDDMEIASPSKVFADYGYYTIAGFNKGIEDNQNTTTTIIKDWVGDIENQMKAIENFNIDMSNTIRGLDNLTARVNTQVDMSSFYGEIEKAQTAGMNTSLNSYAENRQAIEVNIPNITLEVDSREIARANYKGQKELGYQIKK